MFVKAATTNDVSCKQLEYTIVHWLRGVKPYERSQALADPAVSFEGGDLTKRPKPGCPQNCKLCGFRPLFFGRSQNSLSKKEKCPI